MTTPTDAYFHLVKRILRYVQGTMKYRISFTSDPWELTAYSDADWAEDIDTLRLTIGFVVFFGKNPISWQSKKQSYVSRSSTEAEYRALVNTYADLSWVRNVLQDLKVYLPQPPLLDCDNLSALALSSNWLLEGMIFPTRIFVKDSFVFSASLSLCKTDRSKRTTPGGCWPKALRCLNWVPNWSEPLTVLGVGFLVGIGLRFLLDLGCPTCVNAWLLFTLLHIANLTSLLSSLREILENLYCLSKRRVAVHPKAAAVVGHVCADGPAAAYYRRPGLEHVGPRALQASSAKWMSILPDSPSKKKVDVKSSRNEAANSLAKDVSPLRKKPRIPYAEKTQVRVVSSSSAKVKHLACVDSRRVGECQGPP
ncbi:unnamed protein product [Prunus armeniaca]